MLPYHARTAAAAGCLTAVALWIYGVVRRLPMGCARLIAALPALMMMVLWVPSLFDMELELASRITWAFLSFRCRAICDEGDERLLGCLHACIANGLEPCRLDACARLQ